MIPTRDGTKLSADLIRPDAEGRFPAIVMYQPYRKDDVGRGGIGEHYYFAERGFVSVRLDARGTGTSEGTNTDEYLPQEQEAGYDAVEWLAQQPWSNGNVGMYGISYSGFTALQVALHRPPHLKPSYPSMRLMTGIPTTVITRPVAICACTTTWAVMGDGWWL